MVKILAWFLIDMCETSDKKFLCGYVFFDLHLLGFSPEICYVFHKAPVEYIIIFYIGFFFILGHAFYISSILFICCLFYFNTNYILQSLFLVIFLPFIYLLFPFISYMMNIIYLT